MHIERINLIIILIGLLFFCNIIFHLDIGQKTVPKLITKKDSLMNSQLFELKTCKDSSFTDLDSALIYRNCVKSLFIEKKFLHFPEEIASFPNLEMLVMNMQKFDTIPESISKCKNLNSLFFPNGRVSYIHPKLWELPKLRTVNFLFNQLNNMPEGICNANELQSVNFNGNFINEVPECLSEMKSIQIIHVVQEERHQNFDIESFERVKRRLPEGVNIYYK